VWVNGTAVSGNSANPTVRFANPKSEYTAIEVCFDENAVPLRRELFFMGSAANPFWGRNWDSGNLAGIIVLDAKPDESEIQALRAYIKSKYKIHEIKTPYPSAVIPVLHGLGIRDCAHLFATVITVR
jgi:hypothetical protein